MRSLNFAVEFSSSVIIKMSDHEVRQIDVGDSTLGYIAINGETITPFTARGEMPEADCLACAARAIFASDTGISADQIAIAEAEKVNTQMVKSAIISALMKSSIRH